MISLFIGLLVGAIACAVIVILQRQVCADLIQRLEADRDLARNEAKVYRELLFPVLRKTDTASGGASTATTTSAISPNGQTATVRDASPKAVPAKVRTRMPFRIRFNEMRRQMNTPQQKTDAMADALEKTAARNATIQKAKAFIEEQNHVS